MKGDTHDIEFLVKHEHWNYGISLYARQLTEGVKQAVAQPLVFKDEPMDMYTPHPIITLSPDQAQSILDQLWGCGVRPSDGSGSTGQLKATQDHLADMKKIVFKQLNIK